MTNTRPRSKWCWYEGEVLIPWAPFIHSTEDTMKETIFFSQNSVLYDLYTGSDILAVLMPRSQTYYNVHFITVALSSNRTNGETPLTLDSIAQCLVDIVRAVPSTCMKQKSNLTFHTIFTCIRFIYTGITKIPTASATVHGPPVH